MRRKVTFMRVEKTKQPLPENGHIFVTMPLRRIVPNPCNPEWKPATCPICGQGLLASDRERRTGQADLPQRKVRVQRVRMDRKGGGKPMNIRKFISTYKCRLCGETFQSVGTPNINNAYAEVFDIAMYHSGVRRELNEVRSPSLFGIHHCDDGSVGLADLQGMKKVGGSDG